MVVELAIANISTLRLALMEHCGFCGQGQGVVGKLATYGDDKFTYLQGGLVITSGGDGAAPRTLLGGIGISRQDAQGG